MPDISVAKAIALAKLIQQEAETEQREIDEEEARREMSLITDTVTMTENSALTFWYEPDEDVYSPDDGEPV